jgi:chromosome segregation ATPase
MDLIIAFLAAMSGALVGASLGVFVLSHRLRPGGAELDAVRTKLQSSEFSLKTATANIDRMRQQIEEQEQAIRQAGAALQEKQQQLDKEAAERATAGQRVEELTREVAQKQEAPPEIDPKAKEESDRAAEELRLRLASYEAQVEATDWQIRQLTEHAEAVSAESAGLRERCEQEEKRRAALEGQLTVERQQSQEFAARITELESDLSRTGLQLQEVKQSAATRMELLVKAQENLSHLVQAAGGVAAGNGNGANGRALPPLADAEPAATELQTLVPAVN